MDRRRAAGALLALAACIACSTAAPMASSNQTALDVYDGTTEGCYYNFQHYGEGDRIMTNEPCLNCTCHNRMLMCYLRVCPFTKPIGQDCTVEKRADQCCPIVTCPDVPVDLLTSTSTTSPAEYGATGIGKQDKYGCSINGRYFPEGSKVPPTPNKPCEHCYCIRNMTTCVMQECTLHVDGCVPIYHKDVCCPVRYSCDHPEDEIPLLDDMTTTVRPTPGFLLTTTTLSPVTQVSQDCVHDDQIFADGALIKTEKACEHCYCMKGDIVCVVQECGTPMENEGKNCTSLPPRHGQCCPDTYICEGDELVTDQAPEVTTETIVASTNPPRKGVEGSGYRNEPDEPYTDMPIFDTTEIEGSGEDQPTLTEAEIGTLVPEKHTPDLEDEMFLTTAKESVYKPHSSTAEPSLDLTKVPKSESNDDKLSPEYEHDIVTESAKPDVDIEDESTVNKDDNSSLNKDTEITDDIKDDDTKVTQEPSLTTIIDDGYEVSSSSESLTSREDQLIITTEPSFRKEDFVPTTAQMTIKPEVNEVTTQVIFNDATTQALNKEMTESELQATVEKQDETITSLEDTSTAGAQIETDEQITKTTESSVLTEKPETEKETINEYGSLNTLKPEIVETTSLNPTENEINEDLSGIVSSGRIPGEGDCLLNGITYKNFTTVPSTNKCHTQCRCVSSIVKCDPIICSPPPEFANMDNCQPIYDSAESCCPTYICDHSKETNLPESHSQMSGTESPKPTYASECNGNECQIIKDKEHIVPVQSEPCMTEKCLLEEKKPELSECGAEGCTVDTVQPMPAQSEECVNGKCEAPLNIDLPCDESTGCQVNPVKPCEGDDCRSQLDIETINESINCENNENCKNVPPPETESTSCKEGTCTPSPSIKDEDSSFEKECESDSCRRKETSKDTVESTTICSGEHCDNILDTENTLKELTTQTNYIAEETTKAAEKDDTTVSEIYFTGTPDQKLTSTGEADTTAATTFDTSSNKIDIELQEQTTSYEEYHPELTDSSVTKASESFTTKQPEDVHETLIEISTNIPVIIKEKESLTTTPHNLLTEPTLAEENTETQQTGEKISYEGKETTMVSPALDSESDTNTRSETVKITTPSSYATSGLYDSTLSDLEKHTIILDNSNENTTPRLEGETFVTETGTTEPSVTEEKINKEHKEKDLVTPSYMIHDSDLTTETLISKTEGTTSKTFEEVTTKLLESEDVDEKLTEGDIIEITTQRNLETTKLHEISTDISNVNNIELHTEINITPTTITLAESMPTELSTEDAIKQKVTSKIPDDSVAEHEIIRVTTETVSFDKEEVYKTTLLPDTKVTDEEVSDSEKPKHQESQPVTENTYEEISDSEKPKHQESQPVTEDTYANEITESTEHDEMESLNGRGTELPNLGPEQELQTETSHILIPDTHTTVSESIESAFENTQTVLAEHITESSLDTSQKTITTDIVTKLPTKDENKIDIDTESPIIFTTEPSRRNEVSFEGNQEIIENDDNKIITDTINEVTTELPSSDDDINDKNIVDEKLKQPQEPQEFTEGLIQSATTESVPHLDIQTESVIDSHKLSTSDIHDLKPEKPFEEPTSTKPIDEISEEHDIDISTSKLYPKLEDVTETFTESLSDVTQQTEGLKAIEDDHPSMSTELPIEGFSTSKYDSPISENTILPETSENIQQTSTTKQDKDITEPSSVSPVKDKVSVETLPSKDSSVTDIIGVEETTGETATQKLEVTTNVFEISKTEDKKETSTSHMEEFYPHNIPTESNLMMEEEMIGKATTVPQTILEEESYTIYPDKEPTLSSQDMEDRQSTTEKQISKIPEPESFTVEHSITTETQKQEEHTEKLGIFTTDSTESITDKDMSNTQHKDKSSEVPDFVTQTQVTEIITEIYETSKTTDRPDLGVSKDLTSEKAELTEAPKDIYTDKNTMNEEEMATTEEYLTDLSESPERVTKVDIDEEAIHEPLFTTEKITEGLKQMHGEEIITESPELSIKVTSEDKANELVTNDLTGEIHRDTNAPEPSTEPAKMSTEATYVEEDSKYTETPEHNINEEPSLEDKVIEMSIPKTTVSPITLIPETGKDELPESVSFGDLGKYTTAPKEDLSTASPEVVTAIIDESEKVDNTQIITEASIVTEAPITKLTEILGEVTEKLENENLEETTGRPVLEITTKDKTAPASEILAPETTSQLPENESDLKDDVVVTDEKDTEHSTETSEISPSKPLETEDKNKITESYQPSTISTLHDGLSEGDISVPTESLVTVVVDTTYESDIKHDFVDEKTPSTTPVLPTQPSEMDLMKDSSPKNEQKETTEVNVAFTFDAETNTKAENAPEKEQSESDKLYNEDNTSIGEQYTQSPMGVLTEKSSTDSSESLTENEIGETEGPVPVTQKADKEMVSTPVLEDFTTQKTETETQMSVSSHTEIPGVHVSDNQIKESEPEGVHVIDNQVKETEGPELHTELPIFMTHVTQKETTYKDVEQTESPTPSATSKDQYSYVTQKLYDETTSQPIESDHIVTEVLELPKATERIEETSKLPENIQTTSKPIDEYSESTPYFVELEEHTHKSIEKVTSEVYHEDETSTVKLEHQYPEKEEYDITTEKEIINEQGYQTEETAKETKITTEEDKQVTTTVLVHDDLDTTHTTYSSLEKSTEQPTETELHTTPHAIYTESQTEITKHAATSYDKEASTSLPLDTTVTYEKQETPKYEEQATSLAATEKEIAVITDKPQKTVSPVHETTAPEEEFILAVTKGTSTKIAEDITTPLPTHLDKFTSPQEKPIETVSSPSLPELQKPGFNDVLPTDDIPSTDEESHFPPTGTSGYGQEPDYAEDDQALGPGTCRYGGKVYVSAQQIPRDDPCDFCFCFRSDIICLQQSCPPPIHGCHEEPIQGFCCPRYECPVSMATTLNITTTTTTTTTTLPPHFFPHAYKGAAQRRGCQIKGHTYKVGEVVRASSGPCLHCTCGGDGQMKCDPKACTPEPMLRQMIAAAVSAKRRR